MSDSSDSGYEDEDVGTVTFALHNAAESGDAETIESMLGLSEVSTVPLSMGALFRRLVNMADSNECTPLHVAIINGHAPCVSALLRGGASHSKPCDGNPPITLAACLGLAGDEGRAAAAEACVAALLAAGADPHDKDDGGRTALHWAACSGRPALVAALLTAAAQRQRERVAAMVTEAVEAAETAARVAGDAGGGDGAVAAGGDTAAVVLPTKERPEHILAMADHDGLTPVHLAAKFGHGQLITQLLTAAAESGDAAAAAAAAMAADAMTAVGAANERIADAAAAAAREAAAAAAEVAAADGGPVAPVAPKAPTMLTAPTAAVLAAALPVAEPPLLLKAKARQDGHTALHLAAMYGRTGAAAALLAAAGAKGAAAALALPDKKGRTTADLARRRGHTALAAALDAAAAGQPFEPPPEQAAASSSASTSAELSAGAAAAAPAPTLLLAPEECLLHRTAPEPILRSGPEPPPENANRLHVLTRQGSGILHNAEFAGLRWRTSGVPQAAMIDVLKCHEWSYVRGLIQACEAVADSPASVGQLDPDTAISRHTMRAALAAAGAVCAAVDEVVAGKARNAFCAVRPPGHHAGPTGVVPSPNDLHGSHGFCLLSNVAIGAAYAMAMHRHAGIKRVAILDFDVHHGNGTQACVINTAPSVQTIQLRTPYSEGVQRFPVYKPWLGDGDVHNIIFASVQGYGRRGMGGWFYPGSGATADSVIAATLAPPAAAAAAASPSSAAEAAGAATPAPAARAGTTAEPAGPDAAEAAAPAAPAAAAEAAATAAEGAVPPEDPDGEFRGSYDVTVVGGPRVINVGIPGPGGKPRMWRRAWRDKILPALVSFRPDLILLSAGFDAHRKEDLNLRYVGVTEADYEWLTGQIVEVANACCGGRLVSVLEGGYNLRGGPLGSAFARSVSAHVRALSTPCTAPYCPADAEAERTAEKAVEARKAAKAAALAAGLHVGSLATPRSAAPTPRGFPPPTPAGIAAAAAAAGLAAAAATATPAAATPADGPAPMDTDRAAAPAAAAAATTAGVGSSAGADGDEPSAKRRRRPPVDYAALNAQLEREQREAAAAGSGGGDAAP